MDKGRAVWYTVTKDEDSIPQVNGKLKRRWENDKRDFAGEDHAGAGHGRIRHATHGLRAAVSAGDDGGGVSMRRRKLWLLWRIQEVLERLDEGTLAKVLAVVKRME